MNSPVCPDCQRNPLSAGLQVCLGPEGRQDMAGPSAVADQGRERPVLRQSRDRFPAAGDI